ncbi:restriction endonuclease subunit S [Collinsella intestinalis]|uniref:restriction endonuclease subunit S n=1 Tax=Collinsella intestinalis TaxID=147207 RepID=UPI001958C898|nr:restriction endonuclease subunit S [Collinsella intestinalis]MBM6907454.1 restriction endonuclease subunit S [Collinsella intestinalis]
MKLGDLCRIRYGRDHKKLNDGTIPVYGSGGVMRRVDTAIFDKPSVLIPRKGTIGNLFYVNEPFWTVDTLFWTDIDTNRIIPKYLYYQLLTKDLAALNVGTAVPSLTVEILNDIEIDVPALDIQERITHLLASFDNKIALNNRLNDYLAVLCESIAGKYCEVGTTCLSDICYQVTDKTYCENASLKTYVSTESLLKNKRGRQPAASLPATGKVTRYVAGDTLVSNIRPYFKKIWYAPFSGTCSGDVLVFRAKKLEDAPFLHACLRQDCFFNHVMRGVKGTKMPRGDKRQMMSFQVSRKCEPGDLSLLSACLQQMATNDIETARLIGLRDALLPKLMSGEIDVSKAINR